MLVCVGFSLKENRLQKVRGSGLLNDWDRTDGRTDNFDFWSGRLSRIERHARGRRRAILSEYETIFFNTHGQIEGKEKDERCEMIRRGYLFLKP